MKKLFRSAAVLALAAALLVSLTACGNPHLPRHR